MNRELHNLIRDGLRYREIRKHRNRGYPQPGIPYACGWSESESDPGTFDDIGYIREGELDDNLDCVLDAQDSFACDVYDKFVAEGVINDVQ